MKQKRKGVSGKLHLLPAVHMKTVRDHFPRLSSIHGSSGKQVFIAANCGDVPEIKKSAVLELSGGNVLFGHSWSKHSSDNI
ncbi:MAG: hypothetical protein IKP86_10130 [Anaerolineaceae bacterium]|nr:hypothetical protein [Anaerolineaceae bacterium]